ncbi:uncharacterized protein [Salminus brasiliensis]|uniref:uncharacterized protein n=1 Tax=Salminus brasiliensis TaxID=930266 RepID=UPI003B83477A
MGDLLSRMAPTELKREEGARAEPYNMLLETDTTLRTQRALKRELCVTRAAVIVLVLLLALCLCLMFFVQNPACKDRGHDGRENEAQDHQIVQAQVAAYDPDSDPDPKQPPSASLKVNCVDIAARPTGNITWKEKQPTVGFTLQGESLVIPKDGMYRISLQVTYRNTDTKRESQQIMLSHSVVVYYKGSPNQSRTFLEVFEYIYWKDFMWKKTKYSQDVLNLQKGDILTVQASNLSFIDCGGDVGAKTFLMAHYEPTG